MQGVTKLKSTDDEKENSNQSTISQSSSVNFLSILILRIMMRRPIVTITNSTKPNQPSTMAEVPTPLLTTLLPISWAIVLAATDAVCCHNTETSTKTEDTKIKARAA